MWGDHDEDHVVARARWQEAAARAGVSTGGIRFNWHLTVTAEHTNSMLWAHDMTTDDLPALAAEAREHFPDLFDRGWRITHAEYLDDRERARRLSALAP